MELDLQKAGLWKRIAAWLLDSILIVVLAVGFGTVLSYALNIDDQVTIIDEAYARYEAIYDVHFEMTAEENQAMTEEDWARFEEAYAALLADEEYAAAFSMELNLMLLTVVFGILLSVLVLEFFIPLLFGNGQTVGKKIFSLCLMRTDSVKMSALQLFIRTVLGKYTLEIMLPAFLLILSVMGVLGWLGPVAMTVLIVGLIAQGFLLLSSTGAVIHDRLAGTLVVDYGSQRIFKTEEERIEFQKRMAAEKAAGQTY